MRLFLNRLSVLAKRSFINPAMYVMSAVILLMALLVIFVPEKDTSVYIPVAVLNNDNSDETEEIVDHLCSMNSIFHFYEVDDEEEIYKDLASGKANTAYIFPKNFTEHLTDGGTKYDVQQISTPASSFIFLSREECLSEGGFPYLTSPHDGDGLLAGKGLTDILFNAPMDHNMLLFMRR
jgi:hypothetical protein